MKKEELKEILIDKTAEDGDWLKEVYEKEEREVNKVKGKGKIADLLKLVKELKSIKEMVLKRNRQTKINKGLKNE